MLSAASRITLHRVFPVEYCPKSIKTTLHRMFFLCHVVWIFLGNIMQDFWLWHAVPREGFLICNVVWSLLDNIAQSFYLCNAVPRVLRQHWTILSGGSWTSLYKTSMLSGFSWATLCSVFDCAMLSQEKVFWFAMLSGVSWTTLYKVFTYAMLFQEN